MSSQLKMGPCSEPVASTECSTILSTSGLMRRGVRSQLPPPSVVPPVRGAAVVVIKEPAEKLASSVRLLVTVKV